MASLENVLWSFNTSQFRKKEHFINVIRIMAKNPVTNPFIIHHISSITMKWVSSLTQSPIQTRSWLTTNMCSLISFHVKSSSCTVSLTIICFSTHKFGGNHQSNVIKAHPNSPDESEQMSVECLCSKPSTNNKSIWIFPTFYWWIVTKNYIYDMKKIWFKMIHI